MGETIRGQSAEFNVRLPLDGHIKLIRDGITVAEAKGKNLSVTMDTKGAYRVEVRRKRKPWIYSNHIRLLDDE